ncbi:MAG: excinuclease ABC subunit UvrC [Tissierellia bacterium]|nr:excinuclease ABC subunit UvrC [Tissierellia bacterium]
MFNIKNELSKLPEKPGVYLMYDKDDTIIYVGKAINLKNRVRQYFDNSKNKPPKVVAMVSHIVRFEYIIVDNEVEALVLESNFIKKNRPKYNILLRDDKQYPYIKITNEKYPRVMKVRNVAKDRAQYFGPFPNVYAVNDIIQLIHELFKIRTCNLNFNKGQRLKRPCLNYFIKRCPGPCIGEADEEKYLKDIQEISRFLNGKHENIIKYLTEKMYEASSELNFEQAAKYRDNIESINVIYEKQKVTNTNSLDMDMISFAREEGVICVQVFFMRNGKIVDREHFILEDDFYESDEKVMASFMKQFYLDITYIPKLILVDYEVEEKELIEKMLSQKKQSKVAIRKPQRGDKVDLMEMVRVNAKDMLSKYISRHYKKEKNLESAILDLKNITKIENLNRIECFDISNTSGVQSVGSMVVFENGKKAPKEYRKFKIKTVKGPDDYASHREVLTRRLKRGIIDREKGITKAGFGKMPSLIMMDGGKGQVNIAKEVLRDLNLNIPVIGLVKDDNHKTRGIIFEEREILLKVNTPLYRFLFNIQEEAHRFAINYHRKLRDDNLKKSELDEIPGIGKMRKMELYKYFKTLDKIKDASIEELLKVPKMNKSTAENIYTYFRK